MKISEDLNKFLSSVKNHEMEVVSDTPAFKHLKFAKAGSINQSFEIVTYSDMLTISGDMGTYSFRVCNDMFGFFESPTYGINPSYWSGKLCSISTFGGLREIKEETVVKAITDYAEDFFDSYKESCSSSSDDSLDELQSEFFREIEEFIEDSSLDENHYPGEISNFNSVITEFDLSQCLEKIGTGEFVYQYIWCCRAITWAIEEYKKKPA